MFGGEVPGQQGFRPSESVRRRADAAVTLRVRPSGRNGYVRGYPFEPVLTPTDLQSCKDTASVRVNAAKRNQQPDEHLCRGPARLPSAALPGRMVAMATRPDDAILSLPVDERLALVDSIWESIRKNADALPVDETTRAEMQRRLDLHHTDPDSADDLDVVLARLRAKD